MPPTFQRSGKVGGISGAASPRVLTVVGNAGETAVLFLAFGFSGTQPVPTITGGGIWTRQGIVSLKTATNKNSIECWTNDGTAFASLSIAYTNAPNSMAFGVGLYSGVGSIGLNTASQVTAGVSFPETLVLQDANNIIVIGWSGDDASTPDPYSAGASTNLRDQLAESSAIDTNFGFGDRSGGPGSLTATLIVTAAACNAAGCAVELRSPAGATKKLLQESGLGLLLESGKYLFQ